MLLQLPCRAPDRPLQLEGGRQMSLTQFLPAESGLPRRTGMVLLASGRTTFMAGRPNADNGIDRLRLTSMNQ